MYIFYAHSAILAQSALFSLWCKALAWWDYIAGCWKLVFIMPKNNIIIRANALYIIIFFLYELLYTEYIYLRNFSYLFSLVIGATSLRSVTIGSIAKRKIFRVRIIRETKFDCRMKSPFWLAPLSFHQLVDIFEFKISRRVGKIC